ncbi:MAG: ABC transporter permease [Pseudomonadota bacterium]
MLQRAANIFRLGVKELRSVLADPVLAILLVWTFTFAIYEVAQNAKMEISNASIAIVDEDRSELSRRIQDAFLPPYFKPAVEISGSEIDRSMDTGKFIFVVDIPPGFEADLLSNRKPEIQVNIDATAMSVAGTGASYIQTIITSETLDFLDARGSATRLPLDVVVRASFNPNLNSTWFMAVMQIVNNVTVLAMILTGAALIREREHGTIEHLLVMPVTSAQIMIAKVWANGFIIVVAAGLSLTFVVQGLLQVPIAGSKALFIAGAVIYLFSITSLGILLATMARSMPQFGLLAIPVFVVMELLSGGTTPMESMPAWLQTIMQASPSTHYVSFSQAVLYRGAWLDIVWPQMLTMAAIGSVFFAVALLRFRRTIVSFS